MNCPLYILYVSDTVLAQMACTSRNVSLILMPVMERSCHAFFKVYFILSVDDTQQIGAALFLKHQASLKTLNQTDLPKNK